MRISPRRQVPPSPAATAITGEHRIVGRTRGSRVVVGLSGDVDCVWSTWTVEDHYRRKRRNGTDVTGWENVHEGRFHGLFVVTDDSGTIIVDPGEADVDELWTETRVVTRDDLAYDFRGLRHRTIGATGRRRVTERFVPAGELVDITGVVERDDAGRPVLRRPGPRRALRIRQVTGDDRQGRLRGRAGRGRTNDTWAILLDALRHHDEGVRAVADLVGVHLERRLDVPDCGLPEPDAAFSSAAVEAATSAWRDRAELHERLLAVADAVPAIYADDELAPIHTLLATVEREVARARVAFNGTLDAASHEGPRFAPERLGAPLLRRESARSAAVDQHRR